MKISISRTGTYIPKWRANRDLPSGEQLVCEYDYLTWEQRQKHITNEASKFILEDLERKKDDDIDREIVAQHNRFEKSFHTDDAAITADMKPRFRNFEDDQGNVIDTWAKVLKTPITPENRIDELITEITGHCSNIEKERDPKNS